MAEATPARSDDASRAAPLCPPEQMLGTHRMDDSDEAFQPLPDLTTGRTLADAIAHLDWVAAVDPASYGKAWTDEMRDIGVIVMRERTADGPMIQTSHPCDHQLLLRRERSDAMVAHFKSIDGGRAAILAHLEINGSAYGYMFRVPE